MDQSALSERQQFWRSHVEACELSGVSMKAYGERHGLKLASFYCWKGQLKKLGVLGQDKSGTRSSAASLVPVEVVPQSEPGSRPTLTATRIALASGIVIEAPSGLDADALCDLLRAAIAAGGPGP
jgi:hypothetical protein